MPNPLAALAIVEKALDIVKNWQANRPINKLRYRIEAAIEYVLLDERVGEYKSFDDEKRLQYKNHFRKRIFDE